VRASLARKILRVGGQIVRPVNLMLRRMLPTPRIEQVTWHPAPTRRAAGPVTVAFLTDIHLGPTTPPAYLRQSVHQVNALSPDLVVLGGDYFFRSLDDTEEFTQALAELDCPLGVFAVLGNHDHWLNASLVTECLESAGVTLLTNRGVRVDCPEGSLWLCGVDDLWTGEPDIAAALDGRDGDEIAILLSHNPDFAPAAAEQGVDLMLSGHTHGGQIRLFGRTLFSNSSYGDTYLAGWSRLHDTDVYVSRGIGSVEIALRLGAPAEISLISVV
jgi:predicted MPP superfamily phosphohydrolase